MIKKIVTATMALAIFSLTGCSDKAESTVNVDGIERNYTEHLPNTKEYDLVIGLHGGGGSIKSFEGYSQLTELQENSDTYGVVYLEGIDKHWNDGRKELNSSVDDVAFIEKIIKKYRADGAQKVYVVGMSNGGLMAQRAACDLDKLIDGIGIVGATQSTYIQTHCSKDASPMDAVFIFGTEDSAFIKSGEIVNPLNPSEVRGHHIQIIPTIEYWTKRNQCLGLLAEKATFDDQDDSTIVHQYDIAPCSAKVRYFEVEGGGHRWPNPDAYNLLPKLGYVSHEISAGEQIVNFFGLQ